MQKYSDWGNLSWLWEAMVDVSRDLDANCVHSVCYRTKATTTLVSCVFELTQQWRTISSRVSQKNNFFEKYRWSGLIWFSWSRRVQWCHFYWNRSWFRGCAKSLKFLCFGLYLSLWTLEPTAFQCQMASMAMHNSDPSVLSACTKCRPCTRAHLE